MGRRDFPPESHHLSSSASSINYNNAYIPTNPSQTTKQPNQPPQIKMQFSTIAITFFAALAAASPLERRQLGGLCGSALDPPQCCDVSVGGLANLNCASPISDPASVADFQAECNGQGQSAYCCVLPILGDALVCTAL